MPIRLILDVDTGTDDAVAIMAAVGHPDLELVAVTTVDGNVALANTTENTLRVLDHVGADVPVHAGSPRPLVRPHMPVPREVLNADNPEFQVPYLELPPSRSAPASQDAVRFLVETFLADENDDVVLVAVGPLTNVAAALAAEPRLASRIRRLVVMGGAHVGGNVTATAEFNFWADPEAARLVLAAGIADVTIVPLDATHAATLDLADCAALHALGTPAAVAAASLLRHRIEQDLTASADPAQAAAPVHDAVCVALLADPGVAAVRGPFPVAVETAGELTLGEMVVDTRAWATGRPNARVAMSASRERFRAFLLAALGPAARS